MSATSRIEAVGMTAEDALGFRPSVSLRMFGMRRSGNHAIASWLQRNAPNERALFLNNCRRGETPLSSFSAIEVDGQKTGQSVTQDGFASFGRSIGDGAMFLVSYEDNTLAHERDGRRLSGDFDVSVFDRQIILYRGFLNWAASMMKKLQLNTSYTAVRRMAVILRSADVYSQLLADSEREDVVAICYDDWCVNSDYRAALLAKLGLPERDNGLGDITGYGGGSSFQKNASAVGELKTDQRWLQMQDDPTYRGVLMAVAQDPALVARIGQTFPADAGVLQQLAAQAPSVKRGMQ